ncbi:hypothetical protein GM30_01435 [Trabulsiella odontotermitis]|nr:hypothetical protein GM30_01435 [Trabulsiella odontotermitis]
MLTVLPVDHRQQIEVDAVCDQPADRLHHFKMRRFSAAANSPRIMKICRAIKRNAHQPVVIMKKTAPFISDQ